MNNQETLNFPINSRVKVIACDEGVRNYFGQEGCVVRGVHIHPEEPLYCPSAYVVQLDSGLSGQFRSWEIERLEV